MNETVSAQARSRWIAVGSWILLGTAVLVAASGLLPFDDLIDLAVTTGPVLVFVIAMTIVAELASAAGVFTVIAEQLAVWGRRRVALLWAFVLIMVTLTTAFLSLDTTAVLVTPIIVLLARHVGLSPLPFALAAVWLANTASLFFPVSNLTNLLAADVFGETPFEFLSALWAPALTGVVITTGAVSIIHRRSLAGRFELTDRTRLPDRQLFIVSLIVVCLLLPALVSGLPVSIVAGVAAVLLLGAFAVRNRRFSQESRTPLNLGLVPWRTIAFAASLFILVRAAEAHGLASSLTAASGTGDGFEDLLQLAAVGALGANAVNNLPAYLAFSSIAESPLRMGALLIGVNLAPLVSPWASLATLLWHQRLTKMGVRISWARFALLGLGLTVVMVPTTTFALWLSNR
ncbi:SLC13 family permease [Brevibacterium sp. FME37]|uniref:SLC13 family permease n=1 Tax=Brevibacterium sp. FME37 TaxID=2742607 RepID=UPI00299F9032|nr:SLC13 family permease [Brevibacterium sp. FME37]